jgi:hypothetical protein
MWFPSGPPPTPSSQTHYPVGRPLNFTIHSKPSPSPISPPPSVPDIDDGHGDTSVSTDALNTVANNMDLLAEAVISAGQKFSEFTGVDPGGLIASYTMKSKVGATAPTPATGLATAYSEVLADLEQGLNQIAQALRHMASTYKTFDDLNKVTAADVYSDFTGATGDFGNAVSANGGTAPSAQTTT